MSEWKSELDALVAENMAFVNSLEVKAERPRPQPREAVERVGLKPLDYGGNERDEIRKRVESFKKHQERFTREREEFAASMLRSLKRDT